MADRAKAPVILIRPPEPDEREAFIRMALASWLDTYDGLLPADTVRQAPDMITKAADKRFNEFRVAVSGDKLLGYYSLGDANYLWHLYVDPAHFRQGLGKTLLTAAEDEIRQRGFPAVELDVTKGNDRAVRFYEAQGFVAYGEDDGEILMKKDL